jgi:hypothetical protein
MLVIPATQETEIRRNTVPSQPKQKFGRPYINQQAELGGKHL